ncbi:TetR/AcrR family transcriptional regulator [Kitasatospora gansuensis]
MSGSNEAWLEQARREVSPRKLEKQIALASAACMVFGREGYARASVDALAAAAGVSTRTLYNHFPGGKADLFRTVVTWTSGQVRDAQLARLGALLDPERPPGPEDLARDLIALARAFVGLMAEYPNHFALVRHIHAEADHVPPEVLQAWVDAGPGPVGRALAEAMAPRRRGSDRRARGRGHGRRALHGAGLALDRAALPLRRAPAGQGESDRLIEGGVRAFLRAYRAG